MFTYDPIAMLVRAYEQERLQEAERARLRHLARQGRAGAGHPQDITRKHLAARFRALGATVALAALVAMVAAAALLVVIGHAPILG